MSSEQLPENSGSPDSPRPTREQQEELLEPILEHNMQRIIENEGFFSRINDWHQLTKYSAIVLDKSVDVRLNVCRDNYYERSVYGDPDNREYDLKGDNLMIGLTINWSTQASQTSFIYVAKRLHATEGTRLVAEAGFTEEDAQFISDMIDELELAKMSGQIPDLHFLTLNSITNPQPPSTGDEARYFM